MPRVPIDIAPSRDFIIVTRSWYYRLLQFLRIVVLFLYFPAGFQENPISARKNPL